MTPLFLLTTMLIAPAAVSDTTAQSIDVSVEMLTSDREVLANLGPRYSLVRPAPGMTYLYRYNCGGDSIVDSNGNQWMGDDIRYSSCGAAQASSNESDRNPVLGSFGMAADAVTVKTQSAAMYVDLCEQPLLATYRTGLNDLHFHFPVSSYQSYSVELYLLCMPQPPHNSRLLDFALNEYTGRIEVPVPDGVDGHSRVIKCSYVVHTGSNDYIDISARAGRLVIAAIAISTLPEIATMSDEVPRPEGVGFPYSAGLTWEALRKE